jgi:hypothetical protein
VPTEAMREPLEAAQRGLGGLPRASRKRMSGTEKHLARGDIGHLVYHPIARGA